MGRRRSSGILFISDGRLLVLRRSACSRNGGKWGLPGGRRGRSESAWIAAWRESVEEMGHVPLSQPVGAFVVDRPGKQYKVFVCRAAAATRHNFAPELNHEHTRARWVDLSWCRRHMSGLHPVLASLVRAEASAHQLERALDPGRVLQVTETAVARTRVRSRAA